MPKEFPTWKVPTSKTLGVTEVFAGRQRECFYRNLRHMTFDTNFQLGKIWFVMVSGGEASEIHPWSQTVTGFDLGSPLPVKSQ